MAAFWSKDLTTPVVTLTPGQYNYLDARLDWTPNWGGEAHYTLYAKLLLTFKPGITVSKIRRRADRAATKTQPVDPTAYEDITVTNRSGAEFEWLVNAAWDGQVWTGRKMSWLINIPSDFASAKLTTRYAKAVYWP